MKYILSCNSISKSGTIHIIVYIHTQSALDVTSASEVALQYFIPLLQQRNLSCHKVQYLIELFNQLLNIQESPLKTLGNTLCKEKGLSGVKIGTLFTNSKVFYIVASYPHVFPRLKTRAGGKSFHSNIYIQQKQRQRLEKIGFQTYCIHKHIITHVHIVTSESQNAHAYSY